MVKDFLGQTLEVGQTVLFHPKGLAAVSDHLTVGTITRITAKTVYVEYHCEHLAKVSKGWNYKRVEGVKEYPRRFDQVYVLNA